MSLIKIFKAVFIWGGVSLSLGCSASEYSFESGKKLCLSSDVVEAKRSAASSGKYRRLVVNVGDMPIDVAISHVKDSSVSKSLLLAIEDASEAELKPDYYSELFKALASYQKVDFIGEYGLYKLERESESALKSYDYLKVNPSGLSVQPENLSDWYLGLCVEGIGRPDTCEIKYVHNGFLIKYNVIDTALSSWETITQKINNSIDSWRCD